MNQGVTVTGATLLRGCAALVLFAVFVAGCSDSEAQSVGGGGPAADADTDNVPSVVTLLDSGELFSWEANAGPSATDLEQLVRSFDDADAAMLIPPVGGWPDGAVVEVRVDRYIPPAGYVTPYLVLRNKLHAMMALTRAEPDDTTCDGRRDGDWNTVQVRSTAGCALSGVVSFVIWNESDRRWHAESGSYNVQQMTDLLDEWDLLEGGDY